jgi:hypothetical protein
MPAAPLRTLQWRENCDDRVQGAVFPAENASSFRVCFVNLQQSWEKSFSNSAVET